MDANHAESESARFRDGEDEEADNDRDGLSHAESTAQLDQCAI